MLLPTCDGRQATRDSDASGRSKIENQQNKFYYYDIELKIQQQLRETAKWACALRVSSHLVYMSNAIGSSLESNPSRRICHLLAVPLGHVSDKRVEKIGVLIVV